MVLGLSLSSSCMGSLMTVTVVIRLLLSACCLSVCSKYFIRNVVGPGPLRSSRLQHGTGCQDTIRGLISIREKIGGLPGKAGRAITPHTSPTPRDWVQASQTAMQVKEGSARTGVGGGSQAKAGHERGPVLPEVACPSVMGQKQPGLRTAVDFRAQHLSWVSNNSIQF